MNFYNGIAEQYDLIFPFSPPQKEFITSCIPENKIEYDVLDIGCGTGNLTIALSPLFRSITGIDLEGEMIRAAKQKSTQPNFLCRNMLELSKDFSSASFDLIVSFGNTLVHLDGLSEVAEFFSQTRKVLKKGGKILLQIINYDRVLAQKVDHLPTIENEQIRFERLYDYQTDAHRINFETHLTLKATGEVLHNSVSLYPLVKEELKQILIDSGFETIHWYGNFKKAPLTEESIPLVVEAY